ncbi:hypothetical protein GRS96_17045 [Rathayibacter sp. VKM Ac-2803]|uniref:hypothetical protein n=1 Tax=unclassified Rathayibacter TaxID=2609250 RepID=UPI0013570030|nr:MULTISPECIES: hypothetical protein [unclassified Rathayibacter]MWV50979.1 hypothetical protein [Rathayibacter sp. VKM Ac-2803]MWV57468.1 hypothetical protein [Rathayibacter sp. VKM Ac-2754]
MDDATNPLGAFTRGAAIAAGWTEDRVRSRILSRPFHGIRTVVEPRTHLDRARAYLPRLRAGQYFSHLTAAIVFEIPLAARRAEEDPIHVSVLDPARPPRCRGVIGHVISSTSLHFGERLGLPVTDAESTWLLLGAELPLKELVAATDHLLFTPRFGRGDRPFATRESLTAALEAYRGRGSRALRSALADASESAASRPETDLRLVMVDAGLPEPVANAPIYADGRLIAIGDLVIEKWKVLVEYDGEHHRTGDAQFARDRRRLLELQLAGWIIVPVRKEGLGKGRARTIAEIRAALHAHGWRG